MFFNYVKAGIRNLLKYKAFSFINVFGLAAAMSVGMLIILMLADQKSHDQFNEKKDRTYRLLTDRKDWRHPYATSPVPLAATIIADYPIVETATHLVGGVGGDGRYKQKTVEMRGYFADTSFFSVFSFALERGDRSTALATPNSLILTHEMAERLFKGEDPMGKTVEFTDRGLTMFSQAGASVATPWGSYTVTGVIADNHYRSHLQFDVLMSASSMPVLQKENKLPDHGNDWTNYYNCYTYVVLAPGKDGRQLDTALSRLAVGKYAGLPDFKGIKLTGQALTRISPGILLGNEATIVLPLVAYYFLSFLALVIILSACLNYINLSIARALKRSKEIGVRRVSGALRTDLILQFLGESLLTALCAMGMAILLLFLLKAAFVGLWVNRYLHFELQGNTMVFLAFLGLALLIGLVAGIYPALYLSKIDPILALKSDGGGRPGRLPMRKVLGVSQFALSLFFVITSILIYNQFRHFIEFKYEFTTGNIVNVNLQSNDYKAVTEAFRTVPGVSGVSACQYIPASTRSEGGSLRKAADTAGVGKEAYKEFMSLGADEHFFETLGLKLVAGRNLPAAGPTAGRYIVVNEAAAGAFGYQRPADMVGQSFKMSWSDSAYVVIGVVQDFHMRMLLGNDKIDPLFLQNIPASFQYVNVRIASRDTRSVMAALDGKWKRIDPVHPMKYDFFDQELAEESQGIFDVVSILGFIAFLAVIIACLGMLGMATYSAERRRKEVGIRKVLGAGDMGNALLLSREFIHILLIAIAIAAPLSYTLNTLWLRRFPNRVDFGWGTVLLGTGIILGLGLLTIASQTIGASRRNPVESLRAE
jgi:putative ABC transport system permease protein